MIIIKKFDFDAAHYLPSYNGKCERLHGHTYRMFAKVEGIPDSEGMVIDFIKLKEIVKEKVLVHLDHACLNDIIPVPSAENICSWIWQKLETPLRTERYHLFEIEVWETATSGCAYRGEGN
ncbi:MAG: 6-carboxytetrahydropterin synthase QueD [Phascolarctobacterium sp.]|nr:6-carboxytetrahydropterin synthase QueD [Phascolarctobacterium sp.]